MKRAARADQIDERILGRVVHDKRVIAQIEEFDIVDIQRLGGILGLLAADGLHLVEALALFPEPRAFAPLAVGQAGHRDLVAKRFDAARSRRHSARRNPPHAPISTSAVFGAFMSCPLDWMCRDSTRTSAETIRKPVQHHKFSL
jgi:hypothetical protein